MSPDQPALTLEPTAVPPRRAMFAPAGEDEEPDADAPPSRGVALWLVAAGSLIVGILIGFASGYTAADRGAPPAAASADPAADAAPFEPAPPSSTSQTFTEDDVVERVTPEPVAPEPASEPLPDRAPAPVPARERAAAPVRERAAPPAPSAVTPAPRADASPAAPRTPAVDRAGAPGRGSMAVLSRPSGAQVVLDGRVIGRTPMTLPEVATGTHDVRLDLPGFRPWATSVEIAPGERTRVAASLEQ